MDSHPPPGNPSATSRDQGTSTRTLSLHARLLLLVTAVAVPLLSLGVMALWEFAGREQARTEAALSEQVHAMALAVDAEFQRIDGALRVLVRSTDLKKGDLAGFEEEARSAVAVLNGISGIALIAHDGVLAVNTFRQPGTTATEAEPEDDRASLVPGAANLHIGVVTRRPIIAYRVPVLPDGEVGGVNSLYMLGATVSSGRFADVLRPWSLAAEGWIATVMDRNGAIVARTQDEAAFLGQRAMPDALAAERSTGPGVVHFTSADGVATVIGYARAPQTGYIVSVSMPEAALIAPLQRALWRAALLGLLLISASFLAAYLMSRRIVESLRQVGMTHPGGTPRTGVPEVDRMAARLAQTGAALRASEGRLRRLLDTLDLNTTLVSEPDGTIRYWSNGCQVLYGWSADEAAGRSADELLHSRYPKARDAVDAALAAEGEWTGEVSQRGRNGRELTVVARMVLQRDEQGRAHSVVTSLTDITRQRAAEEALRQLEQRFKRVFDASPTGILLATLPDYRLVQANPMLCRMLGYTTEELIGRQCNEIMHPDERDYPPIAEHGNTQRSFERRLIGKSGQSIPVRVRHTRLGPVGSADEAYVLGLMEDITEQRQAAEKLQRAQRLEEVGQLTAGIAHDFNNLLQTVTGSLEMLNDEVQDRPAVRELVDIAMQAADLAAELTRRLLAFGRKQMLQPRIIDLNEIVLDTGTMLRRVLGETIRVATVLGGNLWSTRADPSQVADALLNLAVNARDAMPDGGMLTIETANMSLEADYAALHQDLHPGEYVVILVSDSGTGMPPGVVKHAMEPFFTTKPPGKGSGLGLSMVYGFAKQSGGHLSIYSELGVGTTLQLYLPRELAEGERRLPSTVAPQLPGGSEAILVVDDDAGVRDIAVRYLVSVGYSVRSAHNGPEALAVLQRQRFDLLFTDVVMPGGMTGYDLAEQALQSQPDLRVLFTTGYALRRSRGEADEEHRTVILKPFHKADFLRQVRLLLDRPVGAASTPRPVKLAGGSGNGTTPWQPRWRSV